MHGIRVGCDIVRLSRFRSVLERTPTTGTKLFLPEEEEGATFETLAGIFAAKESVIKALRLTPGEWKRIEIVKTRDGRPELRLAEDAQMTEGKRIVSQDISISHDGEYVMAIAVFLIEE